MSITIRSLIVTILVLSLGPLIVKLWLNAPNPHWISYTSLFGLTSGFVFLNTMIALDKP